MESFATWIEQVIRERGYDIDSPRGGGKSQLADAASVHRAAITRLLQRQSMPDLETMRRLARVLRVPIRDMLVRSGQLTPEELPLREPSPAGSAQQPDGPSQPQDTPLTLEQAAARLGVAPEQREMFIKIAGQFLPERPLPAVGRPDIEAR
nr:helix-turn-helix transcriptional regulator [Streptomyces boncukensis]